jgi:hypothetical protein
VLGIKDMMWGAIVGGVTYWERGIAADMVLLLLAAERRESSCMSALFIFVELNRDILIVASSQYLYLSISNRYLNSCVFARFKSIHFKSIFK